MGEDVVDRVDCDMREMWRGMTLERIQEEVFDKKEENKSHHHHQINRIILTISPLIPLFFVFVNQPKNQVT